MRKILLVILSTMIISALPLVAYAEEDATEAASESVAGEGGLVVTQKNLIELPGESSAYFFAKIENTSDEVISCDTGTLALFSEDDELLLTDDYISTNPSCVNLQPGEYVYIGETLYDDILETKDIADYKFSIQTEDSSYQSYSKIPCESTLEIESSDAYNNYIYVTFTNDTDSTIWNYNIASAIYDDAGELIYVASNYYDSIGVPAGSSVTIRQYIYSDILEYYEGNSITPSDVDSTVYLDVTDLDM